MKSEPTRFQGALVCAFLAASSVRDAVTQKPVELMSKLRRQFRRSRLSVGQQIILAKRDRRAAVGGPYRVSDYPELLRDVKDHVVSANALKLNPSLYEQDPIVGQIGGGIGVARNPTGSDHVPN